MSHQGVDNQTIIVTTVYVYKLNISLKTNLDSQNITKISHSTYYNMILVITKAFVYEGHSEGTCCYYLAKMYTFAYIQLSEKPSQRIRKYKIWAYAGIISRCFRIGFCYLCMVAWNGVLLGKFVC